MSLVNGTGGAEERASHKFTCSEGDVLSIGGSIRVRVLEVEEDLVVLRIEGGGIASDNGVDASGQSECRTIRVSTAALRTPANKPKALCPPAAKPK